MKSFKSFCRCFGIGTTGKLPAYMIPSFFIQLEKIPLNPNGKIDTKALPQPGKRAKGEYTAPHNEIEKKLVKIWKEILGIERIGVNDNFFTGGDHSLKATLLVNRIRKEFHVEVPLELVRDDLGIRYPEIPVSFNMLNLPAAAAESNLEPL